MAWHSPLTMLCYDHSFTEYEEEEEFAAFQQTTERKAEALSVAPKPPANTGSIAQIAEPQTLSTSTPQPSAAILQVLADLAFWEDEP